MAAAEGKGEEKEEGNEGVETQEKKNKKKQKHLKFANCDKSCKDFFKNWKCSFLV